MVLVVPPGREEMWDIDLITNSALVWGLLIHVASGFLEGLHLFGKKGRTVKASTLIVLLLLLLLLVLIGSIVLIGKAPLGNTVSNYTNGF